MTASVNGGEARPLVICDCDEVLLHMIVFEDCPNQWSLSRPLLALILTNDAFYAQWRGTVLQQQASSPERPADIQYESCVQLTHRKRFHSLWDT